MAALKQSCCGCSLKTGTKIIAVIYLVASVFEIGMAAICLHENYSNAMDKCRRFPHDENFQVVVLDFSSENSGYCNKLGTVLCLLKVTKTQLIVCLVFGITQAVSATLLFFGASESKPVLLLPWMVVQSLVIITMTIVSVIACARFFHAVEISHYPVVGAVYICLMLNVYILLVVSSLCQTLCERSQERT
ncbi:uncharacterized protein LOC124551329 [Schistocerca americana]|uniref:uncharacterized protein LOC124551329 n=1 Tax=Schistocerca americana TaxID=7009 RepID=UPI001F4FD7EB|nr:uncharacterized protein LOC124551329 [Schistocerca americana]XP_046982302.1 uncharacterized protein LOC124551329 [Schistocerca americana]